MLFLGGEVGVKFLEDFLAGLFDVHIEVLKDASGDAIAFAQKAEEDVFGADVGMAEILGLLLGQGEDFFDAGGVRDVADHLLVGAGADLFLDLHADSFEVEAKFLKDIDGDALAEFDQAEEEVLGADEVMVEAIGFFPGEREHLLSARRKIVHWLFSHTLQCSYFASLSNPT